MSEIFDKDKGQEKLGSASDNYTPAQNYSTFPLPLQATHSSLSGGCSESSSGDAGKSQNIGIETSMVETLKQILPDVSKGLVCADLLFQVLQEELSAQKQ